METIFDRKSGLPQTAPWSNLRPILAGSISRGQISPEESRFLFSGPRTVEYFPITIFVCLLKSTVWTSSFLTSPTGSCFYVDWESIYKRSKSSWPAPPIHVWKCRRHLIFGTKSIARIFLQSKKNPEIKVLRRHRGHVRLRYIVWRSSI
jgi:hypothetical protein